MSEPPIRLTELLGKLLAHKTQEKKTFDQEVERVAARLALRQHGLSPDVQHTLAAVQAGTKTVQGSHPSEVWHHLCGYIGAAEKIVIARRRRKQPNRAPLRGEAFEHAFQQIACRSRAQFDRAEFEEICHRLQHGALNAPDEITTELNRLDANGLTMQLLTGIWLQYPDVRAEIGLPMPYPATVEGIADCADRLGAAIEDTLSSRAARDPTWRIKVALPHADRLIADFDELVKAFYGELQADPPEAIQRLIDKARDQIVGRRALLIEWGDDRRENSAMHQKRVTQEPRLDQITRTLRDQAQRVEAARVTPNQLAKAKSA